MVFHVDVDAFFASVEQLLIPFLRGRPVAVGNGCIASCSYEARTFGLHAGMSLRTAKHLCRDLVILDGSYSIYRCFAEHIWQVCQRFTDALETFLDEAYGDATGNGRLFGPPAELGRRLRQAILDEVGLSVTVGLAENRMLAKLAGKSVKPGGVRYVGPGDGPGSAEEMLADLPVTSLLGVGAKTAALLSDLNIATVRQLRRLTRQDLRAMLGVRGELLYERCRGRDVHPAGRAAVRPDKLPRTVSRETTFHQPQCDPKQIRAMLFYLLERAMRTLRASRLAARTVEVTIRYDDWKQIAAAESLPTASQLDGDMYDAVLRLFGRLYSRRVALRHVGIVLSNIRPAENAPTLFDELIPDCAGERPAACSRRLHEAMDAIRDRWGHAAIVTGESIDLLGTLRQDDYGFVLRTPSLTK